MKFDKNLKKLKGDASYRIFYRKKKKNSSTILVYADKNKNSNLLTYDAINKILLKNKILAPQLVTENYTDNFIEIKDFGNQTILSLLNKKAIDKMTIFKKIIKLLIKIQLIKQRKIINFKKRNYKIPFYSRNTLFNEAYLFSKWYAKHKLTESKYFIFKRKFSRIVNNLIKQLYLKNEVFVHRDFHVSNLMMVKKRIGVIDSQDALIGNKAYDLASLIDDVRFKTTKNFKNKLFNTYLLSQKNLNKKHFTNDFEIISVLRNLKIIGIFTRLAIRDNKKKYLKLIPQAWNLIDSRTSSNKFKNLSDLLKIFSKLK